MKWLVLALALLAPAPLAAQDSMRLAVTTSFHNSGLADVLLPEIKKDLGLEVQLLVVGTGQALRLAEAGDVDAVLVHSRAAEDAFVAEGHATHRREVMYNDFVVIGPAGDPALVAQARSATEALTAIAASDFGFVSRGDDSGTHRKELSLWADAGVDPESLGLRYRAVGAGMGAALNIAADMNAYLLADRASWLNFGNRRDLALLYAGDPALFNQYAFLPVNTERHPHVAAGAVQALEEWITSDRAAALIDGYRIAGEQLFVFNARTID